MHPQILENYKLAELMQILSTSKSGELWVVRFVPFLVNDFKKCNAVSLFKKNGIFRKKETLTNEEFNNILLELSSAGYEDLRMVRQKNEVILFFTFNDNDGVLNGIEGAIKKINASIHIQAGMSRIDIDRCCVVASKTWEEPNRPRGFYFIEDLT